MNTHGGSLVQLIQQVWRSYVYPFLSYELRRLVLETTKVAFAATDLNDPVLKATELSTRGQGGKVKGADLYST